MMARLADETYLEVDGLTIEGIVDEKMLEFENRYKRTVDVTRRDLPGDALSIPRLRADRAKRFAQGRYLFNRYDIPANYFC